MLNKIKKEFFKIENRKDLNDDEKVNQLIIIGSSICAAAAVQPIPFADIFILTPIQAYIGTRIGAVRGFKLSNKQIKDLIVEISGVVGLGLLAQQAVLGVYKVGLPGFAGFTTITLVFGATYAICKVIDAYFVQKIKGETLSKDNMKKIFRNAKKESKTIDAKNYTKKFSEKIRDDLVDPSINYIKTNLDDVAIAASIINLQSGTLIEDHDAAVLAAFQRYSNKTDSLENISSYLSSMNEEQLVGITANVKGILHEMEYVKLENEDGDSITASLFLDTNHKGFDVMLSDSNTGELLEVQLKATDNVSYVEDWIDKYPEDEILVTEELAREIGLKSSGISNENVTVKVEEFIDGILKHNSVSNIWDYFPYLSVFSVSYVIYKLFQRYRIGNISIDQFKKIAALVSGIKITRIALILCLLSIPIVNVITGTALIANILISLSINFKKK